mgnify:CR=1 FL=1
MLDFKASSVKNDAVSKSSKRSPRIQRLDSISSSISWSLPFRTFSVLNDLIDLLKDIHNELMSMDDKLKEFVGHTPLQVVAGALLGIVIACTVHLFF